MPSLLRLQTSLEEPITTNAIHRTSPPLPQNPAKKQKMSLTQTYYVASTARSKLGREAGRGDHNLRRLVGHANLLDTLMAELADAEREQEAAFNDSIHYASHSSEPRHIQFLDALAEAEEDSDSDDSDSDSDADYYDEDEDMFTIPLQRMRSPPAPRPADDDEDMEMEEDSPEPELTHDESDSDDDPMMPTSPKDTTMEFSEKDFANKQAIATTTFYDVKPDHSRLDSIHHPQSHLQQPQTPMIAAC